jgi:toxin ParE1/3/4
MRRVRRTKAAREDVAAIFAFVAERDLAAAEALIVRFDAKLRLLADDPLLGPARDELAPRLRSFVVGPYLLLYEPMTDGILLVRVLHGARHLRRALGL